MSHILSVRPIFYRSSIKSPKIIGIFFVGQSDRQVKHFVAPAEYLSVPERRTDGFHILYLSHELIHPYATQYFKFLQIDF